MRMPTACGPSERVHAVLASSSDTISNRYPRDQSDALGNQLAALHAVDVKQVIAWLWMLRNVAHGNHQAGC